MALTVEDGTGVADADAYDTQANADAYLRDQGYLGTWQGGSPLVDGAVAEDATQMTVDGGSGSETAIAGDVFQVASVAGRFTVSADSQAVSGSGVVQFSPAAPSGGFANDAAITFLGLSEAQIRRGARGLDMAFYMRLQGYKSEDGQGLQWPRANVIDEDGNLVGSNTVPTQWKRASFEMARIVPADHAVDLPAWIKRVKAGSAEVEFGSSQRTENTFSYVKSLVAPFLDRNAVRIARA